MSQRSQVCTRSGEPDDSDSATEPFPYRWLLAEELLPDQLAKQLTADDEARKRVAGLREIARKEEETARKKSADFARKQAEEAAARMRIQEAGVARNKTIRLPGALPPVQRRPYRLRSCRASCLRRLPPSNIQRAAQAASAFTFGQSPGR